LSITPKTRITAHANGPIRSINGYQVGFYDVGILRNALAHSGEDFYRVGRLPIPTNQYEFNQVQAIINHPSIQYALVDKDKVVICQVGNNTEWLSIFTDMGYEVAGGGKTPKRLKSFHRPTLLNAEFDLEEINVKFCEATEFSRYFDSDEEGYWLRDPEDYVDYLQDQDAWDRLLDGGYAIHPRLIHKAIENLPVFDITDSNDSGEYYMNPMLRQDAINDLYTTKVFNIRLIGPDGMLKGNCFVSDKLPEGVDVLSWHGNMKTEIKYSMGWQLIAEPQNAKSRVRTDDQTVINMPQLFSKKDMEFWLDQEYEKLYNDAINNRLLMNWKNVYKRSFKEDDDIEDEETYARMQFVGWRWKAMDMNITDSPWLFQTIALSHAKPLFERIPIPCSVSEQVISESMARLIGYDMNVDEGTIRRIDDLKVHVVNDLDYMEMYESHGGNDHDDFFGCFYRTLIGGQYDGEKVVIIRRSPNGLGEYTIFRYVEGEYFPTWTLADGTKVSFPEVTGRGWPMRLSTAIHAGKVGYVGLPSSKKKSPERTTTYTRQDVFNDIRACMIGGGVGGFVNSTMLHSSVFHKHRPYQLCSLEDAIDGCVQTNDPADRQAIEQEAKILVKEVLDSGLPVDRVFWEMKKFDYYLKPGQWVEKYDGKITQLYSLMREKYNAYYKRIVQYSQTEARPNELIHKFGYRLELHALPILNTFRMMIANANQQMNSDLGGTVDSSGWDNLYQHIVDQIESYENESDRHDLVLGLLSASLKHPTSAGKISDQIVMNRYVFPYLEKALQYYGLAKVVSFQRNKDNSIRVIQSRADQWIGRDKNGGFLTFEDPLEYQRFRGGISSITFSSAKTA
jgi:hypothetical protein